MISVVMPVYNTELYLNRALKSVLQQRYDDIEIVLINDGSTDGSDTICKYFSKKYDNIKYYSIDNCGVAGARNYGIEHATGEYIGFVDSDDQIENDMFEKLLLALEECDADIAACAYDKITAQGKTLFSLKYHKNKERHVIDSYNVNMAYILTYGTDILPNKLFKKEIFSNFRLSDGKTYEDIMAIPELVKSAKRIVHINDVLYHYILRSDNITSDSSIDNIRSFLNAKKQRFESVKGNRLLEIIAAVSLLKSVIDSKDILLTDKEYLNELISSMKSYFICLDQSDAQILSELTTKI